ncbi:MAG: arsenite methyltransferase [Phycisphaerales bacterium]
MSNETTTVHDSEAITKAVREHYAKAATNGGSGCGCGPAACCDGSTGGAVSDAARAMGYTAAELAALPPDANLGLGCGNPIARAALKPGETVLDLGSGAGIDCFLAAQAVGPAGRVLGVDMTHEMLAKARANAANGGHGNVEFRLGQIEALPVADGTVDAIISNCVVNLSTDKPRVWREAFRVLRAGGRIAVSDVVATAELPAHIKGDRALHSACAAGAPSIDQLTADLAAAGFVEVRVEPKDSSRAMIRAWAPGTGVENYLVAAVIHARKPGAGPCCGAGAKAVGAQGACC